MGREDGTYHPQVHDACQVVIHLTQEEAISGKDEKVWPTAQDDQFFFTDSHPVRTIYVIWQQEIPDLTCCFHIEHTIVIILQHAEVITKLFKVLSY